MINLFVEPVQTGEQPVKLCSKHKAYPYLQQFNIDDRTRSQLDDLRSGYAELLGRKVSTAVILRRAVSNLAEYLEHIRVFPDEDAQEMEKLLVASHR